MEEAKNDAKAMMPHPNYHSHIKSYEGGSESVTNLSIRFEESVYVHMKRQVA